MPRWKTAFDEYIASDEDVVEHPSEDKPPAEPSVNPPSVELLPVSASEMKQQILNSSLTKIAKGQELYLHGQNQKMINEHYEKRAEKLLGKIWKECKKRTKHSDRKSMGERVYQCRTCGVQLYKNDYGEFKPIKGAAKVAVYEVAQKLRAADAAAGIEWIP